MNRWILLARFRWCPYCHRRMARKEFCGLHEHPGPGWTESLPPEREGRS